MIDASHPLVSKQVGPTIRQLLERLGFTTDDEGIRAALLELLELKK